MKEYTSGIYGNPNFKGIVWAFAFAIVICLILGWFFLRGGHPGMHTQPQPKDNKGQMMQPMHDLRAV